MKKYTLLTLAALAFLGCQNSEKKGEPSQPIGSSANQETADSSVGNASSDTNATSKESIPESFKHAGFQYYGLGFDGPLAYKQASQGNSDDAGQTTVFDRMEGGKAYFKTSRTGQFSQIGDSEVMVDETGVYTTAVSGKKLTNPSLEVPADLAPGRTWQSDSTFTLDSNGTAIEVSQSMSYQAVKLESTASRAGKFETLKITASGTMTVSGTESKNISTMWFAKGVGFVKMNTELTTGGKTQKLSVELVKK
jgi:hypothetical protein